MRLALVALVLLFSGCAGGAGPAEPTPLPPLVLPEVEVDHDHRSIELHQASAGLEPVGFVDAAKVLEGEPARFSDIQFHKNISFVTVNGRTQGSPGGFLVLDISSPAAPELLARYRSGSEDNWYTKVSPDGAFVFLTANGGTSPSAALGGIEQSLDASQPTMAARGIHIVDVTNPRQPSLAGYYPAPVRVINLAVWTGIDRATYVAASMTYDRASRVSGAAAAHDLNFVSILRFEPDVVRLQEVARWQPADAANVVDAFPHDLAVESHPVQGRILLYAAYWDAGAYIVDVTDPTRPQQASRIPPLGPTDHVHTYKPHPGLIDERHYAVLAPETFAAEPPGFHRLVDVTDARRPSLVAQWQATQAESNPENLLFSPHEFSLANGRLYASQFHAGAWVLQLPTFEPVAAWQTALGSPQRTDDWAVDVSSAARYADHVWLVDMASGIVILRETR